MEKWNKCYGGLRPNHIINVYTLGTAVPSTSRPVVRNQWLDKNIPDNTFRCCFCVLLENLYTTTMCPFLHLKKVLRRADLQKLSSICSLFSLYSIQTNKVDKKNDLKWNIKQNRKMIRPMFTYVHARSFGDENVVTTWCETKLFYISF